MAMMDQDLEVMLRFSYPASLGLRSRPRRKLLLRLSIRRRRKRRAEDFRAVTTTPIRPAFSSVCANYRPRNKNA